MSYVRSTPAERGRAAITAALFTGILCYVLVSGLALGVHRSAEQALQLFQVLPDPPPPVPEKLKENPKPDTRAEGAAAPPNIRSEPTEIVAPKPVVPMPAPTPVVAAPIAGVGSDATAGNAAVVGPGTGAGGEGNGRGSGGEGDGSGSGGREIPPEQIRGSLGDADYPRAAMEAGVRGTVEVQYRVGIDGRVSDCQVTRSSRSRELDATTCRLIEERFRFRPSRDAHGRPVAAIIVQNHSWVLERDRTDENDEPAPQQRRRRWPWSR